MYFSGLTDFRGHSSRNCKHETDEKGDAKKTLVLSHTFNNHFACGAHTLIMESTRRNAYDAAFKLKAINLAIQEGNKASSQKLGANESMLRRC